MIKANLLIDDNDNITGFSMSGHAGYAESGSDIICAAVSMLAINTVNSIEKLTDDKFSYQEEESTGTMQFKMLSISKESELLLKAFELGLRTVENEYGKKYIKVKCQIHKEV